MQVSALNLLIAAQQARSGAAPRAVPPAAAKAAETAADSFAPLAFKGAGADAPAASGTNPYSPSAPLGSQIDIRI
jgi:hypothetical protein